MALEQPDNQQAIYAVFKYMFGEWVSACNYDTQQMQNANAGRFIEWCRANWQSLVTEKWSLLEKEIGTTSDTYDYATKVLRTDWTIWQLMFSIWPMLSLAGRAPLKHKPIFTHVSFTIGFDDGKAVQFEVPTQQHMNPEQFKHDGPICTLLKVQTMGVIESIADNGLDALYDKYAVPMVPQKT